MSDKVHDIAGWVVFIGFGLLFLVTGVLLLTSRGDEPGSPPSAREIRRLNRAARREQVLREREVRRG